MRTRRWFGGQSSTVRPVASGATVSSTVSSAVHSTVPASLMSTEWVPTVKGPSSLTVRS
jgi:hypothetical protein